MNKLKLLLSLLAFFSVFCSVIPVTGSFYTNQEQSQNNSASAGCWVPPTVPQLVYPENNYHAGIGSGWLNNPYMDWADSTSSCPLTTAIYYQYESYHDAGLASLAYRSIWLTASMIPAPGTPDGTYYWRVRVKDSFGNSSTWSDVWLLTVDRQPPHTDLRIEDGSIISQATEEVQNGGFETGGSIPNWETRGDAVRTAGDSYTSPHDNSYMAMVGRTADSGNKTEMNGLGQSIDIGSKNLAFWYNYNTFDSLYDKPGFNVIINGREVFNYYASDINPFMGLYASTDWQKAYLDLSPFNTDSSLGISFYAGNTGDSDFQSWVYLDKVTTTEVTARPETKFYLSTEAGATKQYQIKPNSDAWQEADWQTLAGDYFTLPNPSGDYTVYYRSLDLAGNREIPNTLKVHFKQEIPDAIFDLSAFLISDSVLKLSWTVPDDNFGATSIRPYSYDLRYWEKGLGECDESAWDSAALVRNPPVPRFPGDTQDFEINGLQPVTSYCFAIKSCDASKNCSDISNLATAETADPIVLTVYSQDVVINELMWMGSNDNPDDEWLELRNTTGESIDLSGWQLTSLVGSSNTETLMLTIPSGKFIPADGYFSISRLNKDDSHISRDPDMVDPALVLRNNNLQIKLYKGDWLNPLNLMDIADDGTGNPAAGDNTNKWSMERNEDPGIGTVSSNWHTCIDALTSVEYWDKDVTEQGTPGGANRSSNELKAEIYPSRDLLSVGFKVFNLIGWEKLRYELTYDSDQGTEGINGEVGLSGASYFQRDNLILGTCSSLGEVCTYNTGIKNLKIKVVVSSGSEQKIIEKILP